ncbi:MAG: ParG, partial [Verrucomicrobiota bacterium]
MKATLEIPDDLYRRVKARSALEGRPLRSVAVQLFQSWLNNEIPPPAAPPAVVLPAGLKPTRFDN